MSDCHVCGGGLELGDHFCAGCGSGTSPAWFVLGLAPAVATGLVVALIGAAVPLFVPVPPPTGFVGIVSHTVLSTTLPWFDLAFGVVGALAATAALGHRSYRGALAGGLGFALLYAATLAVVSAATGAHRWGDPERLGLAAALALSGALLGAVLAGAFKRTTTTGGASDLPGKRYLVAGVGAVLGVAALMAVYWLLVAAVIILVVLLVVSVVCTAGLKMLDLGGSGGNAGHSVQRTGWFGGKYTEHFDADGNKTGESEAKTGWFGGKYVEHTDTAGNKVGESEAKTGWFGGKYVEHSDSAGNKVGESEAKTGLLGDRYIEHTDTAGNKTGESHLETGIFGDERVVHDDTRKK